jgi:2-amino-4-hydroxy-6-hydroxymethyldihydropteridine diphosphokinase
MRIQPFACIALGSNQGDSVGLVIAAMDRLETLSESPLVRSSLWRTRPVDCPENSPSFVNATVGLWPHPLEQPETLLIQLQAIEKAFGRERNGIVNSPRPLDLDLIVFGAEIRSTAFLTLPHPRAATRGFVLAPLSEMAPDLVLPGQTQTVSELYAALPLLDKGQSNEKIRAD